MQVKIVFKYLLFILVSGGLRAQTINFSFDIKHSNCNNSNNGRIEINVDEVNPPYTFMWNSGSEQEIISGLAPGNYFVTITDSSGVDTTASVSIREIPCEIAPVLVFTPNSDSYNDTWSISNIEYYPNNLILVFNRWGQKVFESKGIYTPWDGNDLLSVPVPDNSYFYIIYNDKNDKEPVIKGTVSIIR